MRDNILAAILFSMMLVIIGVIIYERNLARKYEATELKMSVNELQNAWGNPDLDFSCESSNHRILVYQTISGFSRFVFKFDKQNGQLIQKYDDD